MSSKSVKVRVYERSLEDDTSYCDKMLHLPAEARTSLQPCVSATDFSRNWYTRFNS